MDGWRMPPVLGKAQLGEVRRAGQRNFRALARSLRARLRVEDDSLLLNRELRNHFEHYDTRIIQLAREHPNEGGVDAHIGHPDEYGEYGRYLLRCFDPEEQKFWFRGEPFALQPWVEALRDIRALAQERRLY